MYGGNRLFSIVFLFLFVFPNFLFASASNHLTGDQVRTRSLSITGELKRLEKPIRERHWSYYRNHNISEFAEVTIDLNKGALINWKHSSSGYNNNMAYARDLGSIFIKVFKLYSSITKITVPEAVLRVQSVKPFVSFRVGSRPLRAFTRSDYWLAPIKQFTEDLSESSQFTSSEIRNFAKSQRWTGNRSYSNNFVELDENINRIEENLRRNRCFSESDIIKNFPLRLGENLSSNSKNWEYAGNFDSWGPNLSKFLEKIDTPIDCRPEEVVRWKQMHLLGVIDKIVSQSYNYCHHHIPFWSKKSDPKERCHSAGSGLSGVDCSNLTTFSYLYAFGGTWFTSAIRDQSGYGIEPRLAPGVEVISPEQNFMNHIARLKPGDLVYLSNPSHGRVVHVQIWTGYRVGINFSKDRLSRLHRKRAEYGDYVVVDSTVEGADSGPRYRLFNKSPKMYNNSESPKWWKYFSARRIILDSDFVWPIDAIVVSNHKYSYRSRDTGEYVDHKALADLQAPHMTPVFAARKGRVSKRFYNTGSSPGGNGIYIEHQDVNGEWSFRTVYTHLYQVPPHLAVGTYVETSEPIGAIGRVGNSRIPHLHFMIQKLVISNVEGRAVKLWKNIQAPFHRSVNESYWGVPRYSSVQQGDFIDIDHVKFPELEDLDQSYDFRQKYSLLAINDAQIYSSPNNRHRQSGRHIIAGEQVHVIGFDSGFLQIGEKQFVARVNFSDIRNRVQSFVTRSETKKTKLYCREVNSSKYCEDGVFRELNNGNLLTVYKSCPNLGIKEDRTEAFCAVWRGVNRAELEGATDRERYQGLNVASYFYIDPNNLIETDDQRGFFVTKDLVVYEEPDGRILKVIKYDGEDPESTAPYRVLDRVRVRGKMGDYFRLNLKIDGRMREVFIHSSSFSGQI